MRHALCLFVALLVAPAAQGQALSLADVQAAYEAIGGLRASFTQVVASDFAGDSSRVEGSVLLAGNRYRVKTPDQTVVTDGETTWIYTPSDSQVVVNDADAEGAVTPEAFLTASDERYAVTASAQTRRLGTAHVRLDLTATDASARFAEATLWVRASDRLVTRMRAQDRNGATLDLRLYDLTVNPEALRTEAPFTFSVPEGVEVVDLRRGE